MTDKYDIIQGDIPEIDVMIMHSRITDPVLRGSIMAYYYSFFYVETGQKSPQREMLAGAVLGLLFNTIDPSRIIAGNNELQGFCRDAGFMPIFSIINTYEEVIQLSKNPRVQRVYEKFGDGLWWFQNKRDLQLVLLGPILLTLGKNIQLEEYDGWITKRIRAFMGTLGYSSSTIIWTEATYPTITTISTLSTFISASFHFRREIFRICWAVALNRGNAANLFKDNINLLKGSSMTHIILIDEYLYSRFKEILSLRILADNHKGMVAAWEFLASLPPQDVYFAKILYDKETTACLNRNNFPLHTAAAVAAAKFESPTLVNYRGAEGPAQTTTAIGVIVTAYLDRRMKLSEPAMMNRYASLQL